MPKVLNTNQSIFKILPTGGSRPILVECDDLNDWVCKYKTTNCLFNEVLAHGLAREFKILVPEFSLINVNLEHIPERLSKDLPKIYFNKECFGSFYLSDSKEIDNSLISTLGNDFFKTKLANRLDFLKIALFDLWTANEDRNHNNYNLLLVPNGKNEYDFYAIDHVNIFNGSSAYSQKLAQLTEQDSMLNSAIAKALFLNSNKLKVYVQDIEEEFYIYTKKCEESLDNILASVPDSWRINIQFRKEKISKELFSERWKTETIANFKELVQEYLK